MTEGTTRKFNLEDAIHEKKLEIEFIELKMDQAKMELEDLEKELARIEFKEATQ